MSPHYPNSTISKMNAVHNKNKETEKGVVPDKYFSVQKVSGITQLPSYVLRFWESQFDQLHPQRTRGGHRRYQKEDVELILQIKN